MRRKSLGVLVAGLLVAASAVVSLADGEDVTLKGEVVDMACYIAHEKKGPEHKSCAQMCAKSGVPIGLLTEAGELYLLFDDHANSAPYDAVKKLSGGNAEVTGKKFVKQGVAGIMVEGAKGL